MGKNNSINSIRLIGNITNMPKILSTVSKDGSENFSISFSVVIPNKSVKFPVSFIDIIVYGNKAKYLLEHAQIGSMIYVSGELRFQQWEKNCEKQYRHIVKAYDIQLIEGSNKKLKNDGLNDVTLVGYLTNSPKFSSDIENPSLSFSLVTRNNSIQYPDTFIDVIGHGNDVIDLLESAQVGSMIYVSGELRFQQWEKNGKKQYRHIVKAYNIKLVEKINK